MQKYIELLRKPMQVKPESLRAARQKSSSTPPHVYRLNYNESPYGLGPLSEEALEKASMFIQLMGEQAKWEFVPGPLLKGFIEGWLVILDEVNFGDPGVLARPSR